MAETDEWNQAIDAALVCCRERNYATPNQLRKLKNGNPVWDSAIEAAAKSGTGKLYPTPQQIAALIVRAPKPDTPDR